VFDFRSGGRGQTVVWMIIQRSEPETASPKGGTGIAVPARKAPRPLSLPSRPGIRRCSALARQSGNRNIARDVHKDGRQACARMDDAEGVVERLEQQQALSLQGGPVIAVLSPAERKVLEQLRTYRTLREIGERLLISRTTVKTHVASIYSKLGVTGRAEDTSLDPDS
jgi:DNA-binding CsgD family transcriptional regulator